MRAEIAGDGTLGTQQQMQRLETLRTPIIEVQDDAVFKTYAVRHDLEQNTAHALGVITLTPSRIQWLNKPGGRPTGEYSPCNSIKGFVGTGEVYTKSVRTDLPLAGLRTVIAQRKAARVVKRHLK